MPLQGAGGGPGASQARDEEGEDWLLGYLATTPVGLDPKLNAATQRVAPKKKKGRAKGKEGGGPTLTSILGIKRGTARRSWAPGQALAESHEGVVPTWNSAAASAAIAQSKLAAPADAAADSSAASTSESLDPAASSAGSEDAPGPRPDGDPEKGPALAPVNAGSRLAMLQAGRVYHRDVIEASQRAKTAAAAAVGTEGGEAVQGAGDVDNFLTWAAATSATAPEGASRSRLSSSGGGLRPAGVPAARQGQTRRMSTSRISMSGRRQSMDYSELDAVKQRLTHAASLWAVADDDEEGTTDDDEEDSAGDEGGQSVSTSEASAASETTGTRPGNGAGTQAQNPPVAKGKGFLKMFGKGKG